MGDAIKPGDRVRATFEGTLRDDGLLILDNNASYCLSQGLRQNAISVEKIDPPVVHFKPGQVVRSKARPAWLYLLTSDGGYAELGSGNRYSNTFDAFTSEHYELVEVGTPF